MHDEKSEDRGTLQRSKVHEIEHRDSVERHKVHDEESEDRDTAARNKVHENRDIVETKYTVSKVHNEDIEENEPFQSTAASGNVRGTAAKCYLDSTNLLESNITLDDNPDNILVNSDKVSAESARNSTDGDMATAEREKVISYEECMDVKHTDTKEANTTTLHVLAETDIKVYTEYAQNSLEDTLWWDTSADVPLSRHKVRGCSFFLNGQTYHTVIFQ